MNLVEYIIDCIFMNGDPALSKKEFRQHQECFECEKYVVDKNVGWREGFSSY